MKQRIAKGISWVGNPLVLAVLAAVYVNFTAFELKQALLLLGILLIFGVLPVFFYIHREVKAGRFADHDVSSRNKRQKLYVFGLLMLAIMTGVLYFCGQPNYVIGGAIAAWVLAALSFVINFKLKTSLHTGYAFLIGFLTLSIGFKSGLLLIGFAFLVGWSRVTLRRHTLQEVFMGGALGTLVGTIFYQMMF